MKPAESAVVSQFEIIQANSCLCEARGAEAISTEFELMLYRKRRPVAFH